MVYAFLTGANQVWLELNFTINIMMLTGPFNVC